MYTYILYAQILQAFITSVLLDLSLETQPQELPQVPLTKASAQVTRKADWGVSVDFSAVSYSLSQVVSLVFVQNLCTLNTLILTIMAAVIMLYHNEGLTHLLFPEERF